MTRALQFRCRWRTSRPHCFLPDLAVIDEDPPSKWQIHLSASPSSSSLYPLHYECFELKCPATSVRDFEQNDTALPDVYLVIRIDGKGFHRFSDRHSFEKPNDARALRLMNEAALRVCRSDFGQQGRVFLAFGESDEFSFALHKSCVLFNRRISKLASTCVSLFTSYYVRLWSQHFPHDPLDTDEPGPSFDARFVIASKTERESKAPF